MGFWEEDDDDKKKKKPGKEEKTYTLKELKDLAGVLREMAFGKKRKKKD